MLEGKIRVTPFFNDSIWCVIGLASPKIIPDYAPELDLPWMSILDLVAVVIHIAKSLAFYIPNIFARIFEAQSSKIFEALTIIGFDETGELKDKHVSKNSKAIL